MSSSYSFCPFCGTAYSDQAKLGFAHECENCQKTFFQNQNSTVSGVLVFENQLLLTKRGRDPFKDCWDVPGGFVEPQEHPEEALIRELKEELNLTVQVEKLLTILAPQVYVFQDVALYNSDHVYLLSCATLEGIHVNDDVIDYKLFSTGNLPPVEELAFECTPWAVEQFREGNL